MASYICLLSDKKEVTMWLGMIKWGEKGRKKEQIKIAKSLLDILDIETISIKTGLSVDEVKELK